MKLLKKLLPIASVAGVAAIVTPLVTSCGIGGVKLDGSKLYRPKNKPAEVDWTKQYENDDITKLYHDDLKENPDIFKEDMYCWLSWELVQAKAYADSYGVNFDSFVKLNYTNVKVGEIKEDDVSGYDYFTLSYKIKASVNLDLTLFSNTNAMASSLIDFNKVEINIENVPYWADNGSDTSGWRIVCGIPNEPIVSIPDNLKISMKANGHMIGEGGIYVLNGEEFVYDAKHTDDFTTRQRAFMQIAHILWSDNSSYHLQNFRIS